MMPDTSGENAGTSERLLPGADGTEIGAHRSAKVARIPGRHVGVVYHWQIAKLEGRTMQRFALTRHKMLADACRPLPGGVLEVTAISLWTGNRRVAIHAVRSAIGIRFDDRKLDPDVHRTWQPIDKVNHRPRRKKRSVGDVIQKARTQTGDGAG